MQFKQPSTPHAIKIMVPIDYSHASLRALQWAESIANGRSATVTVVHALDPSPLTQLSDAADVLFVRADERMEAACAGLIDKGITVVFRNRVGRPTEVVRAMIDQEGADLIIVGNSGFSSVKRALLGSNADRILRAVATPALVVHTVDVPRERMRVLIATDFSPDANEAIAEFRHIFLRSSIRLEVRVMHATVPPDLLEGDALLSIERIDWPQFEAEAGEAALRVASEFRADGVETTAMIVRGGAARAILAEARAWRADMIVIGRRGLSGFERMLVGSSAERVLHGADCAVFSAQLARVPEPAELLARAAFIA